KGAALGPETGLLARAPPGPCRSALLRPKRGRERGRGDDTNGGRFQRGFASHRVVLPKNLKFLHATPASGCAARLRGLYSMAEPMQRDCFGAYRADQECACRKPTPLVKAGVGVRCRRCLARTIGQGRISCVGKSSSSAAYLCLLSSLPQARRYKPR